MEFLRIKRWLSLGTTLSLVAMVGISACAKKGKDDHKSENKKAAPAANTAAQKKEEEAQLGMNQHYYWSPSAVNGQVSDVEIAETVEAEVRADLEPFKSEALSCGLNNGGSACLDTVFTDSHSVFSNYSESEQKQIVQTSALLLKDSEDLYYIISMKEKTTLTVDQYEGSYFLWKEALVVHAGRPGKEKSVFVQKDHEKLDAELKNIHSVDDIKNILGHPVVAQLQFTHPDAEHLIAQIKSETHDYRLLYRLMDYSQSIHLVKPQILADALTEKLSILADGTNDVYSTGLIRLARQHLRSEKKFMLGLSSRLLQNRNFENSRGQQWAAITVAENDSDRNLTQKVKELILESLKNKEDNEIRHAVLRVIAEKAPKLAPVAKIRNLETDSSPSVRMDVAVALGKYKDKEATQGLIHLIGDDDYYVRNQAKKAFEDREIGSDEAEYAKNLISDKNTDSSAKTDLIETVGKCTSDSCRDAILAAVVDSSPSVRYVVAKCLGAYPSTPAKRGLIHLVSDSDFYVRGEASAQLNNQSFNTTEAQDYKKLLDDKNVDSSAKQDLIRSLRFTQNDAARDAILTAVGDPSSSVRFQAASGLGRYNDTKAKIGLIRLVADSDFYVRSEARGQLEGKNIGTPEVAELKKLLLDANTDTSAKEEMVHFLSKPTSTEARDALIAGTKDLSSNTRLAIVGGLAKYTDPEANNALIFLATDENYSVQAQARQALSGRKMGDLELKSLITALNHASSDTRTFAAKALGGTRNGNAIDPLQKRLEIEPNQYVVQTIQEALQQLRKEATFPQSWMPNWLFRLMN